MDRIFLTTFLHEGMVLWVRAEVIQAQFEVTLDPTQVPQHEFEGVWLIDIQI